MMTYQITLPEPIEKRLLEQVKAGKYRSLEEAVIDKIASTYDYDAFMNMTPEQIRLELDDAWENREGAVDGRAYIQGLMKANEERQKTGK